MNLTLPTDSNERKEIPITSGCLAYFPAALAGVARVSKAGNDKHNQGESLHHARGKSMDHADCIVRHLMDVQDLLAAYEKFIAGPNMPHDRAIDETQAALLVEASQLCWRALALSQELHERFGSPLAPGARLPDPEVPTDHANYARDAERQMQTAAARRQQIKDDIADQRPEWQARPEPVPSPYAGKIAENVCMSPQPPLKPGFPVTPGVYRSRKGQLWEVARINPLAAGDYPAREAYERSRWTLDGRYWASDEFSEHDLVERVADLYGLRARIPEPYDGYKADFQK